MIDMSKELIQKFVQTELMKGNAKMELKDTDSLLEAGIVDSMGIQVLISYLEKTFSIKVQDDEIIPDNFESIAAIVNLVHVKSK